MATPVRKPKIIKAVGMPRLLNLNLNVFRRHTAHIPGVIPAGARRRAALIVKQP
eukprot:SAG31_NODE_11212_length_1053_cov_1.016771_1_plen_54_part_00